MLVFTFWPKVPAPSIAVVRTDGSSVARCGATRASLVHSLNLIGAHLRQGTWIYNRVKSSESIMLESLVQYILNKYDKDSQYCKVSSW